MSKHSLAKHIATGEPDFINVSVYFEYVKSDGVTKLKILDSDESKKRIELWKKNHAEEEECPIEVLNTKWKSVSWLEQNNIINDSQSLNTTNGQLDVDWTKYRDLRIKTLLINWDLEYEGQKIPVTPEFIDRCPAEIVLALFDKYQQLTVLGADEQGK